MDTKQLREKLEAEASDLKAQLEDIATYNPKTGDWIATPDYVGDEVADQNAHADTTEEWNERRAMMAQLETQYNNVLHALSKDDDKLGICEISGEPIEDERLEINPAARTCKAHIEEEKTLL